MKWPRAQAVILGSELNVRDSSTRNSSTGHTQTSSFASVDITYEYDVGGAKFIGNGIEPFTLGMQNSAASRKQHEKYPAGQKVEVLYDPHNPLVVYLEYGPSAMTLLFLGLGLAFILMALMVWLKAHARIRSRAQVVRVNAG